MYGPEALRWDAVPGGGAHERDAACLVDLYQHSSLPALSHVFEPSRREQLLEEVVPGERGVRAELVRCLVFGGDVIPLVHAEEEPVAIVDEGLGLVLLYVQLAQLV